MKFPSKDFLISHLPDPFFIWAVRLFMPGLWRLLNQCQVSKGNGDRTLLTFDCGHIVVTDSEIRKIGT